MGCPCDQLAGKEAFLSPICIGHLWIFRNLAPQELEALAGHARRRRTEGSRTIFTQGNPASELFLLKSGRVKLTKLLENGGEITLDIRKAGDFIGENMLTEEGVYPVSAVCLEETLTCGFSKSRFEQIVLQHPNIGLQVIKNMSERIALLTDRVGSMALTGIEERLLDVLAQVAGEHGTHYPQGRLIPFPLTHEDLGFLIGAHRVSVTRAMKELKLAGKVIEDGRQLIVTGPTG